MKLRTIVLFLAPLIMAGLVAQAQTANRTSGGGKKQGSTTDVVTLEGAGSGPFKPKMKVSQVKETVRLMRDIDIRGVEVDVYLDVRDALTTAIGNSSVSDNDEVTVQLSGPQIQNLGALLTRSKASGSDSVLISSVKSVLNGAVTSAQNQRK